MAKPDGLLMVVLERELAFLHPLPVEHVWGVGPDDGARSFASCDIPTVGDLASMSEPVLVALLGKAVRAASARPRQQPRSPAASAAVRAGVRSALNTQSAALRDRRRRSTPTLRRDRRPRHPSPTCGETRRPHRRPPAALRRLSQSDPLAHPPSHPTSQTSTVLTAARELLASVQLLIRGASGLTLIGVTIANLEQRPSARALPSPRFRRWRTARRRARRRSATASVRRPSRAPSCSRARHT